MLILLIFSTQNKLFGSENTNTNICTKSSHMGFSDSIYNSIKGNPNVLQDHLKTTLKLNMSII